MMILKLFKDKTRPIYSIIIYFIYGSSIFQMWKGWPEKNPNWRNKGQHDDDENWQTKKKLPRKKTYNNCEKHPHSGKKREIGSTPKVKSLHPSSRSTPTRLPFCKKIKCSSPSPNIPIDDEFWEIDCDTSHYALGSYLTEDLDVNEISENDTIELETNSLHVRKDDHIVRSLIDLTPKDVEELRKRGLEDSLLQFFQLISNNFH